MDRKYYLAIDIGASSGRHLLGGIDKGRLMLEEVYRFENWACHPKDIGSDQKPTGISEGVLAGDIGNLTKHVIEGLKKYKEIGKIPQLLESPRGAWTMLGSMKRANLSILFTPIVTL